MKGAAFLHSTLVFFLQVSLLYLAIAATITDITTDQTALLSLKANIVQDPSEILSNWTDSTPVCSWIGVTCSSGNQRVTGLNLSHMGLYGTIPSQLGNLSFLASFSIRNNKFYGSLPDQLASLVSLKLLDLGFNSLSGNIPSSIGSLSRLENLLLEANNFDGSFPVSLFRCSQLQVLSLSSNNFTGSIPMEVGNLTMLRQLYLKTNGFTGSIPSGIGNCSLLQDIDVSENYLTGFIPSEIVNLQNLQKLNMGSNSLFGNIPYALFNRSTIRTVVLYTNKLSGSLPPTLGHFLPNLEQLRLAQNELTGIIPGSISNATKLTLIDLSDNSFTGFIPVTLGNLRSLQSLNLANNSLTSESSSSEWSLLTSLASCGHLTKLELSDNPIDAMLPSSIGNLSNSLQQFLANNCNNKGTIPADIGNLTNLISLGLENNALTGVLPNTVGRLERLQGLYLQGNKLQGSIRDDLCQLDSLVVLSLGDNKLFGSIPECLGNITSLRQLYLSSNNLNSSIPLSMWNLKDILFINISSNSLSGPITSDIGNLRVVVDFDLSNNNLSGEIPETIGELESVAVLSLARNHFQGLIPSSLGKARGLESLDLSYNKLSGEIPMPLQTLLYLTYFNVSFNRLQGKIPDGGAFANFSAQSFMMNKALCGAQRLNVTPCVTNAPKRRTMTTLKLILLVLPFSGLLLLGSQIILWLRWKRKSRTPVDKYTHERYSYHELKRATDGFSEGNLLGTGRFGSVYKGILEDGLVVAIKVYNLDTQHGLNCFDIESEVMHNIRHRSLIRILCSCSSNKFKALVMEYMVNGSLEKWLYTYNYRLDMVQRLDIMIDTALAVQHLHYDYTKTIIHCDLKPSNILLDEDMIAHVSNFGSAKILGHDALASLQGITTTSTDTYMAPEFRVNGTVSAKTDVYSFGILLLETFTGKSPTDEMFSVENNNLRNWAIESLLHDMDKVIDPCLLQTWEEHLNAKLECFSYIIRLAQSCSEESPNERLNMKEVVTGLNRIKHTFLKHISGE